jgi:hypothetical protein
VKRQDFRTGAGIFDDVLRSQVVISAAGMSRGFGSFRRLPGITPIQYRKKFGRPGKN